MSIRWLVLAAPLFVGLAAVAPLRATSPLRVLAPGGCPAASALERAVAAHVGRSVALDGVVVSIQRGAAGWRARLVTEAGVRELDAESCEAALDAVALVLALAVEPERGGAPATGTSPAAENSATRAAAAIPAKAAQPLQSGLAAGADSSTPRGVRSGVRDDPLALGLSAGVLGEVGVLPAASLGARLAIGARWSAWRVELAGLALLPRRAELVADADLSAQIGWWAAQLATCRRVFGGLEGCLGSELGALQGAGSGVDAPRTARGTWIAESLGAIWSAPWPSASGPWSWQLGSNLALGVVRPEFGFDRLGVLHRPSPFSGRLWLGIDWR